MRAPYGLEAASASLEGLSSQHAALVSSALPVNCHLGDILYSGIRALL